MAFEAGASGVSSGGPSGSPLAGAGSALARPGDWVRIHRILLPVGQRAPNVPPDTAEKPYETWINGFAVATGQIGQDFAIRTLAGREVRGTLVEIGPGHFHSFGRPHPAMLAVGPLLRTILAAGADPEQGGAGA